MPISGRSPMGEAHQTGSSAGLTDLRQTIPGSPARSNRRPIELGLPAIPDLRPLSRRVINATSTSLFHAPHSIFAKRLMCCADQLNPPRKAAVRRMGGYGMAAPGAKGPFDRLASTAMSMPAQRGTGYANEGAVAGLVMVLVGLLNVLAAPLLAKLLN